MDDHPWTETLATVVACEQLKQAPRTWSGRVGSLPAPVMQQYAATFSYRVNGMEYFGKYVVHEDLALGHNFTISYDPEDPAVNTGSEDSLSLHPGKQRLIVVAVVVGLLATALYFGRR
jgi:hypothetical protein